MLQGDSGGFGKATKCKGRASELKLLLLRMVNFLLSHHEAGVFHVEKHLGNAHSLKWVPHQKVIQTIS